MTRPTLGRDCQIVLLWAGQRIDLTIVTGFHAQQVVRKIQWNALDADPTEIVIPQGWTVSFSIDRNGDTVDRLFALIELGYRGGGGYPWSAPGAAVISRDPTTGKIVTNPTTRTELGHLYVYISEPNGSTTTFEYTGVTLTFEEAGTFASDGIVKQRIGFFAGTRNII